MIRFHRWVWFTCFFCICKTNGKWAYLCLLLNSNTFKNIEWLIHWNRCNVIMRRFRPFFIRSLSRIFPRYSLFCYKLYFKHDIRWCFCHCSSFRLSFFCIGIQTRWLSLHPENWLNALFTCKNPIRHKRYRKWSIQIKNNNKTHRMRAGKKSENLNAKNQNWT